jgi:hypothetical protein
MTLVDVPEGSSGIENVFFGHGLIMPVPYLGVIPMPETSVNTLLIREAYRAVKKCISRNTIDTVIPVSEFKK